LKFNNDKYLALHILNGAANDLLLVAREEGVDIGLGEDVDLSRGRRLRLEVTDALLDLLGIGSIFSQE